MFIGVLWVELPAWWPFSVTSYTCSLTEEKALICHESQVNVTVDLEKVRGRGLIVASNPIRSLSFIPEEIRTLSCRFPQLTMQELWT